MLQSARLKLTYKPKPDDKDRLKLAFSNAISGLQTSIQITKRIAGDVGLGPPGLQVGLSGLLLILNAIQVGFDCILCAVSNSEIENVSKRSRYRTTGEEDSNDDFDSSKIAQSRQALAIDRRSHGPIIRVGHFLRRDLLRV